MYKNILMSGLATFWVTAIWYGWIQLTSDSDWLCCFTQMIVKTCTLGLHDISVQLFWTWIKYSFCHTWVWYRDTSNLRYVQLHTSAYIIWVRVSPGCHGSRVWCLHTFQFLKVFSGIPYVDQCRCRCWKTNKEDIKSKWWTYRCCWFDMAVLKKNSMT